MKNMHEFTDEELRSYRSALRDKLQQLSELRVRMEQTQRDALDAIDRISEELLSRATRTDG